MSGTRWRDYKAIEWDRLMDTATAMTWTYMPSTLPACLPCLVPFAACAHAMPTYAPCHPTHTCTACLPVFSGFACCLCLPALHLTPPCPLPLHTYLLPCPLHHLPTTHYTCHHPSTTHLPTTYTHTCHHLPTTTTFCLWFPPPLPFHPHLPPYHLPPPSLRTPFCLLFPHLPVPATPTCLPTYHHHPFTPPPPPAFPLPTTSSWTFYRRVDRTGGLDGGMGMRWETGGWGGWKVVVGLTPMLTRWA